MTDEELSRAAQVLLDMPAFHHLWSLLEKQAVMKCINADPKDHDTRQAYAAEARAIISFKSTLATLARREAFEGKPAPL